MPGTTRESAAGSVANVQTRERCPAGLTELCNSGEFEQPCNERNLPRDVALRQPSHLSLPDHVHRLDALNRARRRPEAAEALTGPNASFQGAVVLLNGLITNDKFCLSRVSQQKLRYVRGPRAFACQTTSSCAHLRDEPQHRGGAHEATMASPSSVSVEHGCRAAVGSGLPTSPGMDSIERAGFRSTASVSLYHKSGGER